jgi:DNA-binding Lrp family transcriptional regulator
MKTNIPNIYKQIYKEDILRVMEKRYSTVGSVWVSHQMDWCNGVYASFKDHDKFLIVISLVKKTLDFYSRNFIKLTYEDFYSKDIVEIEKFSISEISIGLKIPKESARRKILELVKEGVIRKVKKKIIIDRSKFFKSKPVESIKRISRFLSTLSEMCVEEKVLLKKISSDELELVIKDNFSYIWKTYYELQIPMMINYKKIFIDLEAFHIWAICVVNQHLYVRKVSKDYMDRDDFLKAIGTEKEMQGINAMSISDITSIPRATVIRKLKRLVKLKFLTIDIKKHYRLSGKTLHDFKPIQKKVFINLSNFSTKVYNLIILYKKKKRNMNHIVDFDLESL